MTAILLAVKVFQLSIISCSEKFWKAIYGPRPVQFLIIAAGSNIIQIETNNTILLSAYVEGYRTFSGGLLPKIGVNT
jgi:hypothetical protein